MTEYFGFTQASSFGKNVCFSSDYHHDKLATRCLHGIKTSFNNHVRGINGITKTC